MFRRGTAIALTLVVATAMASAVAEGTIFGKSKRGRRSRAAAGTQTGSPPQTDAGSMNTANTIINADGTTQVSLQVQLERGLRAMRPVEFQFLEEVLKQVKAKKLSQDMVEQAFLWAHKQRAYRVQYFEKALQALAQQNNISFQPSVSSFDPGFNQPGGSEE